MATATAAIFVEPETDEYWGRLGIFPEGIVEREHLADLERKTRAALYQLGVGNLRLLCEQANIPRGKDDGQTRLADLLMQASLANTLVHLREFLRRRYELVEEAYAGHFPDSNRRAIEASISNLSANTREQLKTFSKLILLYRKDRELLQEIFYLRLSRLAGAAFVYEPESGRLPADAGKKAMARKGVLEKAVQAAVGNRPIRYHGSHTLRSGVTVVTFDRQFTAVLRPDFHKTFNVHFGCGNIVLCVHPKANRVELRLKNRSVAETLLPVLNETFGVKLQLTSKLVFGDYDPDKLTKAILAEYPESGGLRTTAVGFRRSALPNQAPLAVEIAPHATSIREDLAACQASGMLNLKSLLDVGRLTFAFGGMTAEVPVERSRRGYITLAFDNAEWDPVVEDNFRTAFREAFGVPLNRPLDPTKMTLGLEGVYGYLLEVKSADQVLEYQEDAFQQLVSDGILIVKAEEVLSCRNPKCAGFRKPQADPKRTTCPKCDTGYSRQSVKRIFRNAGRVRSMLADVFRDAGWTLDEEEKQFEGTKYYALRSTDGSGPRRVCALIVQNIVGDKQRAKLERSARALVVVKARTADRPVYLDSAGVGNVSLAYLLAAAAEPQLRLDAVNRLKILLDDLHRDNSRRVHQSAQRSYMDLRDKSGGSEKEFETDVFNVLRALFPETIRLGRESKREPDGFSAVPWYENADLRDGRLWAWSYDAKLAKTSKPYDLSSDEYRKVKDYVNKLRDTKALFSKGKRLMAAVLISNRITADRMKVAAEYLYGSEGVKPENREVAFVLMTIEFLLRLYERVRNDDDPFRQRWPHFVTEFQAAMCRREADGYVMLTAETADAIAGEVLNTDPVHPIVTEDALKASLDKH